MARERYLLGDEEEAINKPGAEIKADTKKSKWDNFWFYHKWHVIVIASICLLVGWFVHDLTAKVNPDYQIALLTKQGYPSDMIESMQNGIAKYGKDLNGDGKVVVQINSYSISTKSLDDTTSSGASSVKNTDSSATSSKEEPAAATMNQQVQQADMVRFMADATAGSSIIYLTDDDNFKNQQSSNVLFTYLDGTIPQKGATDYDKMRVPWSQCKLLPQLKISGSQLSQSQVQKALSNLSISMRVYPKDSGNTKQYYDQVKALFNKLVYDK
ncbi:MAG TPA: hypothetical protein VHO94_00035 [Oscillospiraceae bacterium]|nr:hypothetical protein [Oscillospiraceae bacterium]